MRVRSRWPCCSTGRWARWRSNQPDRIRVRRGQLDEHSSPAARNIREGLRHVLLQFFRGLPTELDEAAKIDGAGYWRICFRILLPISLPALATTAITVDGTSSGRTPPTARPSCEHRHRRRSRQPGLPRTARARSAASGRGSASAGRR
ncbi:ABC transporter permease subunit [Streptomyces sp. UG1]|uniref:ABC transporter permease subunit n=1 Tax=Streptomyces sp. UG1 TaxID=3417652 RepID=UPI003CF58AC3